MTYPERLSDDFIKSYEDKTPPWGPVGYITYKRTYARRIEDQGRTEEWHETIGRAVNGILGIGSRLTEDEACFLFDSIFNLKCCISGRGLWQMGTPAINKLGGDSAQNCWAVAVNDPIKPFTFTFNELMLGGGVGFNIQQEFVYEIPKVKHNIRAVRKDEKDVDYIVPDNREGWVELLKKVLEGFFYTGKSFSYSTICVRPKGALIKSFGGVASGPEDLCMGIQQICGILASRTGKKLRPIDCLDIMNIIGSIVVAGNVRRSAQLALGDINDIQYLNAKNWGKNKKIPKWRGMSNNSVACNEVEYLTDSFWNTYSGESEPYGIINLKNCRRFGRLADGIGHRPDHGVIGTNPCGEVPLHDHEACNLAEIFLPRIANVEEFQKIASIMYKYTKAVSYLPFIHDETNAVVSKNHRLGISVTGFLQATHMHDPKNFDKVYKHIEELDQKHSKHFDGRQSIKLTTVKPSGTLSLLPQVTPGVHPAFAPFYIRRIRMATNDPLVELCRKHNYNVVPQMNIDGSSSFDTMVVEFPIATPPGTILAKDLTAVQQLEHQKFLQTWWSDNSVSVTVYYRKDELPEIKQWLKENYNDSVKSVSFLLHSEHGFQQAPYEEIPEKDYERISKKCKPITRLSEKEARTFAESLECAGGSCPVR